ncbi:hypothetical protein BCR44DRAFT_268045 [Catenaria anguillulae PL171]|uniref:Uncharacterized protein n=1 Tax=Catenaria anguillulae PL171 TaxID=765915 RepID=A0A1Y2H3U0_9FUNG|nr:hypothetical protein BCR44DRAFT_268045 [Catenaria anguillulae PL171]
MAAHIPDFARDLPPERFQNRHTLLNEVFCLVQSFKQPATLFDSDLHADSAERTKFFQDYALQPSEVCFSNHTALIPKPFWCFCCTIPTILCTFPIVSHLLFRRSSNL